MSGFDCCLCPCWVESPLYLSWGPLSHREGKALLLNLNLFKIIFLLRFLYDFWHAPVYLPKKIFEGINTLFTSSLWGLSPPRISLETLQLPVHGNFLTNILVNNSIFSSLDPAYIVINEENIYLFLFQKVCINKSRDSICIKHLSLMFDAL